MPVVDDEDVTQFSSVNVLDRLFIQGIEVIPGVVGNIYTVSGIIDNIARTIIGENNATIDFQFFDTDVTTFTLESELSLSSSIAKLASFTGDGAGNPTGELSLALTALSGLVTDTINSKGLEYAADYSGNFTDESLITKRFLENNTVNIYNANGTLSGNRNVSLAGFNLGFTGGTVGIGTTTPEQNLHIISSGTTGITSAPDRGLALTDATAPRIMFEDSSETTDDKIMAIRYSVQNLTVFSLNDVGTITQTDDILVINRDGNVGIGTANPALNLTVAAASGDATILIDAEAGAANEARLNLTSGANSTTLFFRASDNEFGIFHLSTTRFRIKSNGTMLLNETGENVGIGETVPDAKLDIFTDADDAKILRLGTDRHWTFEQEGVGSSTALRLRNTLGINKDFFIDTDGSTAWRNTDGTTTFMTMDQGTGNLVMENSILMRAANSAAATQNTATLGFRKYYNYIGSAATVNWTINTADIIKADVSHVWEFTFKDKAGVASVANPINIIVESGFIDFVGTTQVSITTNGGSISFFGDGTNTYTVN